MKNARLENWTSLLLGVWLFLSPWIISHNLTPNIAMMAEWNAWIVGAVVAVSAGLALQELQAWEEWVNVVLGVWMVLSPWVLGYSAEPGLMWNSLIAGAVITIFSGFAIPQANRLQTR